MDTVVVDTDIISFHVKEDTRFAAYASELAGKRMIMSFMSLAELLYWQRRNSWGEIRRRRFRQSIESLYVLYPVYASLCDRWAEIRLEMVLKGRQLETADAWIAATAIQIGVPLVTHNAKDYQHITSLQLITRPNA